MIIRWLICKKNGNFIAGPFSTKAMAEHYLCEYYTNSIHGECYVAPYEYNR